MKKFWLSALLLAGLVGYAADFGALVTITTKKPVEIEAPGSEKVASPKVKTGARKVVTFPVDKEWSDIALTVTPAEDGKISIQFAGQTTRDSAKKPVYNWVDFDQVSVNGKVYVKRPVATSARSYGAKSIRVDATSGTPLEIKAKIRKSLPTDAARGEYNARKKADRAAIKKAAAKKAAQNGK